jgi:hypothetical protein
MFGASIEPDAARALVKQWLLAGSDIPSDCPFPRRAHLKICPRTFKPVAEAELDAAVP